jgi:hypothetical protein
MNEQTLGFLRVVGALNFLLYVTVIPFSFVIAIIMGARPTLTDVMQTLGLLEICFLFAAGLVAFIVREDFKE